MSVLIDGVPMPKDCRDCCFKYESDASDRLAYCYISGCWIIPKDSERAEICLLKETQPERKPDTIQKFHDYQVEWLKSHYDIEFEPQLEEMIIRFLHDTANSYMMEIDREEGKQK